MSFLACRHSYFTSCVHVLKTTVLKRHACTGTLTLIKLRELRVKLSHIVSELVPVSVSADLTYTGLVASSVDIWRNCSTEGEVNCAVSGFIAVAQHGIHSSKPVIVAESVNLSSVCDMRVYESNIIVIIWSKLFLALLAST